LAVLAGSAEPGSTSKRERDARRTSARRMHGVCGSYHPSVELLQLDR
jgi:hypothetical protein